MSRIEDKIEKYLKEDFSASASAPSLSTGGYDISKDVASLSTGLKRLAMYLQRANTPRKFAIAFEIASDLVNKFPMKSKLVWKAVADAWQGRYAAPVE